MFIWDLKKNFRAAKRIGEQRVTGVKKGQVQRKYTKERKSGRKRLGQIEQSGKLKVIRQGWHLGYFGELISRINRKTTDPHNLEN